MKKTIFILVILITVITILPRAVYADCKIMYGGGVMPACTVTPTPTPFSAPLQQGTTTKGGLVVQERTTEQATPATGPEALPLISLLPLTAAGIYLRKIK